MAEDRDDLLSALRLLERSVQDETLVFEASVYNDPFVPKDPAKSARIFEGYCNRLNEYLASNDLRHFCWMHVPQQKHQYTSFMRFERGTATANADKMAVDLIPQRVFPLIDGYLWGLMSWGTPQQIVGPKCVTCYVVVEDVKVADLLRERTALNEPTQNLKDLRDQGLNDVIYSDAFFLTRDNKQHLHTALRDKIASRRVHFEAYHVIAGIEASRFHELSSKSYARRALAAASMQFQREWGSRDVELRTKMELSESQLRRASDLLRTFDDVLHAGVSTLRSIRAGIACQNFANGPPPSVLRYRLVEDPSTREGTGFQFNEAKEALLLETLGRIWCGEEATAGALSLGRLLAHGMIPDTMGSLEQVDLSKLVDRAAALLKGYAQGAKPRKAYTLDCSGSPLGKGVISVGYLGAWLLSVLIYELFLNAYNHSALPIDIRLRAGGGPDHLGLFIRSRIEEGKHWVQQGGIALPAIKAANPEARKSFLTRFGDVEKVLRGGLSISTRVVRENGEWYEAEICMRGLKTENGVVVHPSWESGQ